MAEPTQQMEVFFPSVPREQQATLMSKLHALICEMDDLYSIAGNITISKGKQE